MENRTWQSALAKVFPRRCVERGTFDMTRLACMYQVPSILPGKLHQVIPRTPTLRMQSSLMKLCKMCSGDTHAPRLFIWPEIERVSSSELLPFLTCLRLPTPAHTVRSLPIIPQFPRLTPLKETGNEILIGCVVHFWSAHSILDTLLDTPSKHSIVLLLIICRAPEQLRGFWMDDGPRIEGRVLIFECLDNRLDVALHRAFVQLFGKVAHNPVP
jgi:hypothetical protein